MDKASKARTAALIGAVSALGVSLGLSVSAEAAPGGENVGQSDGHVELDGQHQKHPSDQVKLSWHHVKIEQVKLDAAHKKLDSNQVKLDSAHKKLNSNQVKLDGVLVKLDSTHAKLDYNPAKAPGN